jgi:hypothetical protein
MMEAARTSETLINFYQTTWRYNPEDSHLLSIFHVRFYLDRRRTVTEGTVPLGRPRHRWEDNIKMGLKIIGFEDED